jgi:phosphoribosylglycinamide formyltransferase-1
VPRALRLGVLVSGRGSNLEAILEAISAGELPRTEAALVVSNRPGVRALEVAARHGVPARVLARSAFVDSTARDAAIGAALGEAGVGLAVLAGYDQLLRPAYFAAFSGRTINIHPSLLPRHGGRGMMGLAVHRAVLAAGDEETGVTIHEVTPELDAGPVVARARVAVRPDDTAETLAERVLAVEHRLLVATIASLARDGFPASASATMAAAPGASNAAPRTP